MLAALLRLPRKALRRVGEALWRALGGTLVAALALERGEGGGVAVALAAGALAAEGVVHCDCGLG